MQFGTSYVPALDVVSGPVPAGLLHCQKPEAAAQARQTALDTRRALWKVMLGVLEATHAQLKVTPEPSEETCSPKETQH
jgi:hypothetical protein